MSENWRPRNPNYSQNPTELRGSATPVYSRVSNQSRGEIGAKHRHSSGADMYEQTTGNALLIRRMETEETRKGESTSAVDDFVDPPLR